MPNADEKAIFNAARRITESTERRQYLEQACEGDVALLARINDLLRVIQSDPEFLQPPAAAVSTEPLESATSRPGRMIGRYKLVELIGEGGMGEVWMAEQQEPVKRLVAIKLTRPGSDSRQVMARFEAERQALALMDHPNIAKIYDGGIVGSELRTLGSDMARSNGTPYFVMELVKGQSITHYCDERRLSLRERLELFVPACQAIQHAHQKGIIHRDIKPNNVLIGLYDGRPVPKIIDFGVAKAIGQELTDLTLHTNFGTVVGTPQYMSPEQAEVNQLDVDTRSDIYSLGVLLYELLSGSPPFDKQTFANAAFVEILRIIREVDPPSLSSKLSTADALPNIAANRSIEPKKLTSLVRGDLDWIVMKSLEKDRSRRYATANGLARDIERYLSGEPVEAGPPGAAYRLRKFAHRHRTALVTATAFALLLIIGAGISFWQAVRATEAERIAKEERNTAVVEKERADTEAAITKAVNEFLQKDLLGQADSANQQVGAERNRNITVLEVLGRAAQAIERKFQNQPLTEAAIRLTLGNAYRAIGELPQAEKHLRRSTELRQSTLGADHLDSLRSMHSLAGLLLARDQFNEAECLYNHVFVTRRKQLGTDDSETLMTMNDLGILYQYRGRLGDAEDIFKQTLDARKSKFGDDHLDTLETMSCLASLYWSKTQYDLAEPLLKRVREGHREKLGSDHPTTLVNTHGLGVMYLTLSRLDEAEALLNESLSGNRKTRGEDHPDTLDNLQTMASLYEQRARYDEAEATYRKVIETRRNKQGPDHRMTLQTMQNFAVFLFQRGRFDESVNYLRQVLAGERVTLGSDHPETLVTIHNLAVLYRDRQKFDEAEPLFVEALSAAKKKLGLEHANTQEIVNNLAVLHEMKGTPQIVESELRELVEFLKQNPGPNLRAYALELGYLAKNLLDQNKYVEAEPFARQCLAIRTKHFPDRWGTFYTKHLVGSALWGQNKLSEAEPYLVQGYEGMKQRESNIPPAAKRYLKDSLERVIQLYDDWGKKSEADEWRKKLAAGSR